MIINKKSIKVLQKLIKNNINLNHYPELHKTYNEFLRQSKRIHKYLKFNPSSRHKKMAGIEDKHLKNLTTTQEQLFSTLLQEIREVQNKSQRIEMAAE